jgi:uncharacterized membrane protein
LCFSSEESDFDPKALGWSFRELDQGKAGAMGWRERNRIYDTGLPGYSNQGHSFGDHFTDSERRAVLEYLKNLQHQIQEACMTKDLNSLGEPQAATASTAKIVYILYLVGIVVGLTSIVGLVMAYVHRGDAPEWLASHYQYQIRTFWIGLLYFVLGLLLSALLIGYLVLLFWMVWVIIRCVTGMKFLEEGRAHPNPQGWMFT